MGSFWKILFINPPEVQSMKAKWLEDRRTMSEE
jgi:hypothetical protein